MRRRRASSSSILHMCDGSWVNLLPRSLLNGSSSRGSWPPSSWWLLIIIDEMRVLLITHGCSTTVAQNFYSFRLRPQLTPIVASITRLLYFFSLLLFFFILRVVWGTLFSTFIHFFIYKHALGLITSSITRRKK